MPRKAPVVKISENFAKNLGDTIRSAREAARINRTEFASTLGASRGSLIKWESGERIPESHVIAMICRLLGLDSNQLLGLKAGADSEKINDRITRLMDSEGSESFKSALGCTTERLDQVLLNGSLAFTPDGLRSIASAYKVCPDWLISGSPEHWAPSLQSGFPERFRFFRICHGIPNHLDVIIRVSLDTNGAEEVTVDGEVVANLEDLLSALRAVYGPSPDFPFEVNWIASGSVVSTRPEAKP